MKQEGMEEWELEHGAPHSVLDKKPELSPSQSRMWGLFLLLHQQRSAGMDGPNPIPASEMLAVSRLSPEDPEDFLFVMSSLDQVFMEWVQKNKGNKNG